MLNSSEIFKHAAIYSIASVLGKAIGFVMLPFYAHIFGVGGYGIVGMTDATLTFLMSIFCFGITGSIILFYHEESSSTKGKVIGTALIMLWIAGLFVLSFGCLFSPKLSGLLFGDPSQYLYVCLSLVSFLFDVTGTAAGSILLIQQRSVLFSGLGLLRLVVGLSLNIYLIIVLKIGLLGYFLSAVATSGLLCAVNHLIALKGFGMKFDKGLAKRMIRFEAPMIPANVAMFVSRQIERILVRFMIGIGGVGILEMAYKFPPLVNLFLHDPFMQAWHTKRTEIAGERGANERIGKMFTQHLFLLTSGSLLLAVCIKDIIKLLTPPVFWDAYRIAQIEIATVLISSCYYHLFFGLYYTKQTKTISLIRTVTSGIKIGLSFVFIKMMGIYGAAYSACLVASIQLLWTAAKAQKVYPIRIEYQKIAAIIVIGVLFFVCLPSINLEGLAVFVHRAEITQNVLGILASSPLGIWKSGLILKILENKFEQTLVLIIRALMCLPYLGTFFLIRASDGRTRMFRIREEIAWLCKGKVNEADGQEKGSEQTRW